MSSVILGSGAALPERVVTNHELSELVDTTDEWIVPRTGVHTRHIATHETGTDLGVAAAERALGLVSGGWQRQGEAIDPASIDMVLGLTLTPDQLFPSQAALIRKRLGLVNATCFDISAACAGCTYGIAMADRIMAASAFERAEAQKQGRKLRHNNVRRVLLVAVEQLSRIVDWTDRGSCILFGDGAAAVVLEWRADEEGVISTYTEHTDDEKGALFCDNPAVMTRSPFTADGTGEGALPDLGRWPFVHMSGQSVFKFATAAMMRCTQEVLERADMTADDITLFVPHQANERIIRYTAKKLGLPMERFHMTIDHTGNVSGASALITLNEALMQGKLEQGDTAVMVAFGGGLTAGGVLFRI